MLGFDQYPVICDLLAFQ